MAEVAALEARGRLRGLSRGDVRVCDELVFGGGE